MQSVMTEKNRRAVDSLSIQRERLEKQMKKATDPEKRRKYKYDLVITNTSLKCVMEKIEQAAT